MNLGISSCIDFLSRTWKTKRIGLLPNSSMPANEIRHSLRKLNLAKLALLKREWRVSMAALIERAYRLGTITEWQRRSLIIQLRSTTSSAREPVETEIAIEQPSLL